MPGPLLRVKQGDEVKVRLVNDLAEATAVHWHGVRLRNAMDGAPPLTQPPVGPGQSFDYRFVAPDAGTFWYHPPERARPGFYGMLIVDEADAGRRRPRCGADPRRPRRRGRRGNQIIVNGGASI